MKAILDQLNKINDQYPVSKIRKGNEEGYIGVKVHNTRQHIWDNLNVAAATRKLSEYITKFEAIFFTLVKFNTLANIVTCK